jgi:hypothetical protein
MNVRTVRTNGARRWVITLAATVASTVAIDAVATAAGLALAASGVLGGASHELLLAVVLATYAAWILGLRANLHANLALLRTTGTSTNALSKAAHDLAARRTARPRVLAWAASLGYVARELAMEVPYYAGAFGAALTDSVTAHDALVFIAGANLGAAACEFAVARGTRAFLRRGSGATAPPARP